MKKYIKSLILIFLLNSSNGISQINCDSLLAKPLIHLGVDNDFIWDITHLFNCGITYEDVEIIDWELMLDYVHRKYKKPSYKDLKSSIEIYRRKSEYSTALKMILCERIASMIPQKEYWSKDKLKLIDCGLSEETIIQIKSYLDSVNWITNLCYAELINEKPYFKMPFETSAFKRLVLESRYYPKVENEIKSSKRKILLYFKNDQSVNCRQIEDFVLGDHEVANLINQNYIFYTFSTSDKTELSEEEWIKGKRKTFNTIGEINLYYESALYKNNNQPLFIILENGESIKDMIGFVRSSDFVEFLEINK